MVQSLKVRLKTTKKYVKYIKNILFNDLIIFLSSIWIQIKMFYHLKMHSSFLQELTRHSGPTLNSLNNQGWPWILILLFLLPGYRVYRQITQFIPGLHVHQTSILSAELHPLPHHAFLTDMFLSSSSGGCLLRVLNLKALTSARTLFKGPRKLPVQLHSSQCAPFISGNLSPVLTSCDRHFWTPTWSRAPLFTEQGRKGRETS